MWYFRILALRKKLQFLNQIDNSYISHATADFDLKRPSNRRVGKGGSRYCGTENMADLYQD